MLRRTTHGIRVDWDKKETGNPKPPKFHRTYTTSREISGQESKKASKIANGYFKIQRFMERIGVHIL